MRLCRTISLCCGVVETVLVSCRLFAQPHLRVLFDDYLARDTRAVLRFSPPEDPRISVAWCKRNEVPIEKVFNKSLIAKFHWAMDCDPKFVF